MAGYVDPKSKVTTGIICDTCGMVFEKQFKYYSAKFDFVEVDSTRGKNGIVDVDRRNLDLDICESCMGNIKKRVLELIAKREQKGTWTSKS